MCQCLLKARANELHKLGVRVYRNDVCNSSHLLYMMTLYDISHVVHLAAQAGVRYSLINPLSYVTANIDCFLVLVDVLYQFPVGYDTIQCHILFAMYVLNNEYENN